MSEPEIEEDFEEDFEDKFFDKLYDLKIYDIDNGVVEGTNNEFEEFIDVLNKVIYLF